MEAIGVKFFKKLRKSYHCERKMELERKKFLLQSPGKMVTEREC